MLGDPAPAGLTVAISVCSQLAAHRAMGSEQAAPGDHVNPGSSSVLPPRRTPEWFAALEFPKPFGLACANWYQKTVFSWGMVFLRITAQVSDKQRQHNMGVKLRVASYRTIDMSVVSPILMRIACRQPPPCQGRIWTDNCRNGRQSASTSR